MDTIDTLVIGAGHAGLAVSHLLARAGREHVVIDRGRVAESWRSERWDSLHLLTPRWMTRLPGWWYDGPDQEGFMPGEELVRHLERYAATNAGPLVLGEPVEELRLAREHYLVRTPGCTWRARNVVVATGPGRPRVPEGLEGLAADVHVMPAAAYRNPQQLPPGGVLVVGASASGAQLADELVRSGRRVTLAVGNHTRVPRRYRGLDLFWWLEATGRLGRSAHGPAPREPAPSMQLVGRSTADPRGTEVDLPTLQALGVELTGRLRAAEDSVVELADDLAATTDRADARLRRLLDSLDDHATAHGLDAELDPRHRPATLAGGPARQRLDLRREGIGTVLLATGSQPHHPWLRVPVVDSGGRVRHRRGVTAAPGLYVVGQPFSRRPTTPYLDGARADALDVVAHLCTRQAGSAAAAVGS